MKTRCEKITRVRQTWAFLALGCWGLILPAPVFAAETAKFKENKSSYYSDFFDQSLYNEGMNQLDLGRWARKLFGKRIPSKNVNIFDEVPDSEFFKNRQGREKLSLENLENGYQENAGADLSGPLKVIAAEQRGIYPRFRVKDARGDEYLLEFDSHGNMRLRTAAEVIASRVYYALGYTVPQYSILRIKADQLQASPDATTWEDTGFKKKLSQKRLEEYLMVLPQDEKGLYRASARKIMKGKDLGIFSFQTRRKEDPMDLVNHRDRREIRTLGIFASWLNHYDLRESDTLDIAVEEDGRTVLRHYIVDLNGALGSMQEGPKAPMLGYEHEVDYGETSKAILGLGFWEKPWQKKWRRAGEKVSGSPAVGYFTNDLFDPARYKTEFPYEAFRLVTRADGLWAAKLLMSFSDEDIRAMVRAGQYSDEKDSDAIARTLIERRDLIARYWLSRANPLDGFTFSGGTLSFKDLAIEHGFASKEGTVYHAEIIHQGKKTKIGPLTTKEPALPIQPDWIPANGEASVVLRVSRASSNKPSPAVTVLLSADSIRGVRHED